MDQILPTHLPVMLKEVVEQLAPVDGEIFLDCTFGAGGYSAAILNACDCKVVAIDRDPNVEIYAQRIAAKYKERFEFINSNFALASKELKGRKFNGIVLDLGVSSMQLDQASRGFSFMHDGPLDMRMEASGISASDFINSVSEKEIADVIYKYGDEVASRRIAKMIVKERMLLPIISTGRLADIVRKAIGARAGKIDPATKTFQAIRIYINDELRAIELFLEDSVKLLEYAGRLVVVAFHSLEDTIIKLFLQRNSAKKVARSKYAKKEQVDDSAIFKILTKKPLVPLTAEVKLNLRSRSAKLRAAVKIGGNDGN